MSSKLEGYKYITYLIGSMESPAEGDDGGSKREVIEKELLLRKVYPINPVSLEQFKVDCKTDKAKEIMDKWIDEGNWSALKDFSRLIWKGKDYYTKKEGLVHIPGDFDHVKMSKWITCLFTEGDKPVGTFGEAFCAFNYDTPIYLITEVNAKQLPKSFLQAIFGSGGMIFNNLGEYLNFIENKYGLSMEK